jgi:hypothetical protein
MCIQIQDIYECFIDKQSFNNEDVTEAKYEACYSEADENEHAEFAECT